MSAHQAASDEVLIGRIANGDRLAMQVLFARHHVRVYRFVLRLVRNEATAEDFEQAMNRMLRDLRASHTGFFHESAPRAAGRIAIAATFTKADTADGSRWVFQDVHPGGVAAQAGIRPGDVLLTVGDKELVPPEATLGKCPTQRVRLRQSNDTRADKLSESQFG